MTIIPFAFYLVMVELAVGAFLTMYALDVRNDSAINFFRTQGVIYFFLFSVLAWATQNGFATPHQLQLNGFNLDYAWLNRQPPLLGWFLIVQIPYNIALWFNSRIGRLAFGGIASALGLATLFVDAMGLRPVAAAWGGGFFTVVAFLLGALALGGVSTAMLLGHWYLNTPTASGKPLEFATWLTIGGLALQVVFGLLTGPTTYVHPTSTTPVHAVTSHSLVAQQTMHAPAILTAAPTPGPTATPTPPKPSVPSGVTFSTPVLVFLQYVLGLGLPLGLSVLALRLERDRSFQSATGMLYIAVVFTFFGEILARGLFLRPLA
jgi:hypothetical protein